IRGSHSRSGSGRWAALPFGYAVTPFKRKPTVLPDIHPSAAAERCPAVRAFEALRVAEAEYGRALCGGAGLFGPHHGAAIDAADDFSRAVPTSRAGAVLHLRTVARENVPPKAADG